MTKEKQPKTSAERRELALKNAGYELTLGSAATDTDWVSARVEMARAWLALANAYEYVYEYQR